MIRALLALPLLIAALPAQAQETSIISFVQRSIVSPPRTAAEAQRILFDHPLSEVSRSHYAMYEATVRTTDGVVTFASFVEPVNDWANSGASFQLDFKEGKCYLRSEILRAYPAVQRPNFPTVWEAKTPYGEYFLYFDETPKNCLVGILVSIKTPPPGLPPARPPSRTD